MQVHGPSAITDHVEVRRNPGSGDRPPFAVLEVGPISIYVYTVAEAAKLVTAAARVQRILAEGDAR